MDATLLHGDAFQGGKAPEPVFWTDGIDIEIKSNDNQNYNSPSGILCTTTQKMINFRHF